MSYFASFFSITILVILDSELNEKFILSNNTINYVCFNFIFSCEYISGGRSKVRIWA